jgi:nicotinate-nucleotide pyrophosphorylase (carboxylating)
MTDNLLPPERLDPIIRNALYEDLGQGDVTGSTLIPADLKGQARLLAKEAGVVAGMPVVSRIFQQVGPEIKTEVLIGDGRPVAPGDTVAVITGSVLNILRGERLALNFLSHLSGIASLTARYLARVGNAPVRICDTRKTTPGLRLLEKYAVKMGGGSNHRFNLGDAILIKDNHIAALRAEGLSLTDIVARARQNAPEGTPVEIEVSNAEEAVAAAAGGPDTIMLDNIPPAEIRRIRGLLPPQIKIEASGGINLETVGEVAATGVDIISIGALTHSAPAIDFSLEMVPTDGT